jgi:isopentenyl diphosphate isomerase/L-lactate dehydrogenase-like FMN-dependent dehydrogenase
MEPPAPLNVLEYEALARVALSGPAYDYYASGALDERTLHDNRAAFERARIEYRVLVDVSTRSLETSLFGHPLSMPVLIAPTA